MNRVERGRQNPCIQPTLNARLRRRGRSKKRSASLANPTRSAAFSPLQNSYGTITPSGLHYERHHGGIPNIDPAKHRLVIHGLVDRPIKYSLADLERFPTLSRTYFMECSGTTGSEIMKAREPTVQRTHGLVSTSEWTGVPVSTLLRQPGLKPGAAWLHPEGAG